MFKGGRQRIVKSSGMGFFLLCFMTGSLVLLGGCSSDKSSSQSASTVTGTSASTADPYAEGLKEWADEAQDKAVLDAPPMTYKQGQEVRLVLSDPNKIIADADALPTPDPAPATATVKVAPTMRAWLDVSPPDAVLLTPKDPEVQTSFNNQFRWEWTVEPTSPVENLKVDAWVQVILSDQRQLQPVKISHRDVQVAGTTPDETNNWLAKWVVPIVSTIGGMAAVGGLVFAFLKWKQDREDKNNDGGVTNNGSPTSPPPAGIDHSNATVSAPTTDAAPPDGPTSPPPEKPQHR